MPQPLLRLNHVSKRFPGVLALDNVEFLLLRGEVHCLVGENGSGKSTFVRCILGFTQPDSGSIKIKGPVGYCPQDNILKDILGDLCVELPATA